MTGYLVRIFRDNRYQNVDIASMTKEELTQFLWGKQPMELTNWICALVKWIQENVQEQHDNGPTQP